MYGHLSCLYVAIKLCATCRVLPDKHQVSLPLHTVLLRIGFTFAQSRQCAGELLPRLSILTMRAWRFISVALSLRSPSADVIRYPVL